MLNDTIQLPFLKPTKSVTNNSCHITPNKCISCHMFLFLTTKLKIATVADTVILAAINQTLPTPEHSNRHTGTQRSPCILHLGQCL